MKRAQDFASQFYAQTGSELILVFGIGCFVYDLVHIWMLRNKFVELGLNPWKRTSLRGATK